MVNRNIRGQSSRFVRSSVHEVGVAVLSAEELGPQMLAFMCHLHNCLANLITPIEVSVHLG
jgi:hypothetical protein